MNTLVSRELMRKRYLGCLLGGAVGDALGYPIEFKDMNAIRAKYGVNGIQTLEQAGNPAVISDNTQMTLFAANALIAEVSPWEAYREWMDTQANFGFVKDPSHPQMWIFKDPRLHAMRAPGRSCMESLRAPHPGTLANPINNSKGCGTVMRAAPYGLAVNASESREDGTIGVYKMSVCDAAFTHGHPMAWASSNFLSQIIYEIVQKHPEREKPLEFFIYEAMKSSIPGYQKTWYQLIEKVRYSVRLAYTKTIDDEQAIASIGEGWVAEEALCIAIFCAVRYQNDFAAAIRAAVNHKGDSDSTGAICGNILGAWLGVDAVAKAFSLKHLELRDVIEKIANQLFEKVNGADPAEHIAPKPAPQPKVMTKAAHTPGMIYTEMTKRALTLCYKAHRDQLDKSGVPYVFHPFHLAEQMDTENEICVALLHDVIEDGYMTLEQLENLGGFNWAILTALKLLTKSPDEDYFDYIKKLRSNALAKKVKLADLQHNADLTRLDCPMKQDYLRREKYLKALAILLEDPEKVRRTKIRLTDDANIYLSIYQHGSSIVKYSIDFEYAEDSHYEFNAENGEKLCAALDPERSLADALGQLMPLSQLKVRALLGQYGIQFTQLHFY